MVDPREVFFPYFSSLSILRSSEANLNSLRVDFLRAEQPRVLSFFPPGKSEYFSFRFEQAFFAVSADFFLFQFE